MYTVKRWALINTSFKQTPRKNVFDVFPMSLMTNLNRYIFSSIFIATLANRRLPLPCSFCFSCCVSSSTFEANNTCLHNPNQCFKFFATKAVNILIIVSRICWSKRESPSASNKLNNKPVKWKKQGQCSNGPPVLRSTSQTSQK